MPGTPLGSTRSVVLTLAESSGNTGDFLKIQFPSLTYRNSDSAVQSGTQELAFLISPHEY